jgi:AraC-like DNA-binding protein
MDAQVWHRKRDLTLWSVVGGRLTESIAPQALWWCDNCGRQPAGFVVAQYLHRGQAVLREAGVDHGVGPGDLFLFAFDEDSAYGRPAEPVAWPRPDETIVTDYIILGGAGLREHWNLLRARQGSVVALPPRAPFLAMMRELADPGLRSRPGKISDLVSALAAAVEVAAGVGRSPVAQAIDAILADPYSDHNLKAIAKRCGCSREHLGRVFHEQLGAPPGEWLRQRRSERALELLCHTDLPLATVAARCGAGSLHRLARWTRELRHLSPLKLRRQTASPSPR